MANFHLLTRKLLKGIRVKYNQTILYGEDQRVSEKTGKIYTEYRVNLLVTRDKYNEMHPENPLNPNIHKSKYAMIPLYRTIKIEEMFLYLYEEIWNKLESGEMYEQGERARKRVRSRYAVGGIKGRSGSAGVLQDALTGEELPGSVSRSERNEGTGEGEGDTVEA